MVQLGRREREQQLLSGMGVQVLVIGFLVFAYTQAARQIKTQREMVIKLKEQMSDARGQLARESSKSQVPFLQAEMAKLQSRLLAPDQMEDLRKNLAALAATPFGFRDVTTKEGGIEKTFEIPVAGGRFTIQLRAVELSGVATARATAGFLTAIPKLFPELLCPVEEMNLIAGKEKESLPVEAHLKWLVATSPERGMGEISPQPGVEVKGPLDWGSREEPFVSPLVYPSAVRLPEEGPSLQLSGIVWEEGSPSCVVNNNLLKVGDHVGAYEVILITQKAVLLAGAETEILLLLKS